MIQPFKQFNAKILGKLNRWLNEFNKLNNMRGDGFIQIKRSGAGTTIGVNLDALRQRLSKKTQDTAGSNTYMVTGSTSVYGEYYCVPLSLFLDNKDTGFSENGNKLTNESAPPGPMPWGSAGKYREFGNYKSWVSTTAFNKDDVVEKDRRVYKSIIDNNLANTPSGTDVNWLEITVRVLNLNEWIGWGIDPNETGSDAGWEPPNQSPSIGTDGQITELQPKLTRLDIMHKNGVLGDGRFTGHDVMGTTRLFFVVKSLDSTDNEQKLTAIAIKESGVQVSSGDDLYRIDALNVANFPMFSARSPSTGDVLAYQQWWGSGDDRSGEKIMRLTWIKGTWYFVPEIEISTSVDSTLRASSGTYTVGRNLDDGLTASSPSQIAASVDGTSIGFNVNGELEQIP